MKMDNIFEIKLHFSCDIGHQAVSPTCGEKKIWSNIKGSQNIMTLIICKTFFCFLCLYL